MFCVLLGSMLLIGMAVGCYESFLILYVTGVLVILFFRGLMGKEQMNLRMPFDRLYRSAGIGAKVGHDRFFLQEGR